MTGEIGNVMFKAVVFDMYETLVTLFNSRVYKGRQIAEEMNIPETIFREIWDPSEDAGTLGYMSFGEIIESLYRQRGISKTALVSLAEEWMSLIRQQFRWMY